MNYESIISEAMQSNATTKNQKIVEQTNNLMLIANTCGDEVLRQECIRKTTEINLPFVEAFVAKYYPTYKGKDDFEDLVSCATVGLVDALKLFNPQKGYRLSTFAGNYMQHEISNYFNSITGLTTHYATNVLKVKRAQSKLANCGIPLERQDLSTLAAMSNLTIAAVTLALECMEASNYVYFDADESYAELETKRKEDNPEYAYFEKIKQEALENAIKKLNNDEQYIVYTKFYDEKTDKDVADYLHITVADLKKKMQIILKKLSADEQIVSNFPEYKKNTSYILNDLDIMDDMSADDILDKTEVIISF